MRIRHLKRLRTGLDESLLLKIGAQLTIFSVLGLMFAARGSLSMPRPVDQIALLLFNLLIWCRRPLAKDRPLLGVHLYLALQTLLISWLLVQDVLFALLFMILYVQSLLLASGRAKLAWILLIFSVAAFGNFYLHPEPGFVDTPLIRVWTFCSIMIFIALMIFNQMRAKRRGEENQRLLELLSISNHQLQEYAVRVEGLAAEEERNRISRDLHDSLGHRLTASIVLIENLPQLLRENRTQRAISAADDASEQLQEGLQELRATVHALRTTKIASANLARRLRRLTGRFEALQNVSVRLQLPDALPPSLSDDQSTAIFRVVQETLTNATKHAHAQNIFLTLKYAANEMILTVRNDGRDFALDNSSDAYGLQVMYERAASLGGTLSVKKPDEGGTLVTLTVPLEVDPRADLPGFRKALGVKEFAALPAVKEMH